LTVDGQPEAYPAKADFNVYSIEMLKSEDGIIVCFFIGKSNDIRDSFILVS